MSDSQIEISVTASKLNEWGLWEEFCEITGMNVWAINEGLVRGGEMLLIPDEMIGKVLARMRINP